MTDPEQFQQELLEKIRQANSNKLAYSICGNNSKHFLIPSIDAEPLSLSAHTGIINYEPTELYITARAGTPLTEIESVLAESNQALAFEPPNFGRNSTLGGCVASGLSGPSRPYFGSVRDYVLGIKCVTGRGELLKFGGQVIKNVAGYDVSRLMTGAFGTLGVLLEISLKVIPKVEKDMAFKMEMGFDEALEKIHVWSAKPLPLSACCYDTGCLKLRISGKERSLKQAMALMGLSDSDQIDVAYFQNLRNMELPFFDDKENDLWRLSVPSNTKELGLSGESIIDWAGAQRWIRTDEEASLIRQRLTEAGGHATLYFSGNSSSRNKVVEDKMISPFQPLLPAVKKLHLSLKQAFDPNRVLNPGYMYQDI